MHQLLHQALSVTLLQHAGYHPGFSLEEQLEQLQHFSSHVRIRQQFVFRVTGRHEQVQESQESLGIQLGAYGRVESHETAVHFVDVQEKVFREGSEHQLALGSLDPGEDQSGQEVIEFESVFETSAAVEEDLALHLLVLEVLDLLFHHLDHVVVGILGLESLEFLLGVL